MRVNFKAIGQFKIMNIYNENNKQPYFLDPNTNLKILIDTGCTKSFIKKNFNQKNNLTIQFSMEQPSLDCVKKKDVSGRQNFHLVIDFIGLNSKAIDDRFPLPNITNILVRSQYFTMLDLATGFFK